MIFPSKKVVVFIAACLMSLDIHAQQIIPKPEKSENNLKLLESAKDSLYEKILRSYDRHIKEYPEDYVIRIERCRFIGHAYYDYSEDYNPNYEKSEACREELMVDFPAVPEVMIFRSESLWGDSVIAFLERVVTDVDENSEKWKGKELWKVYEKLARQYSYDKENVSEAIKYGELAEEHNDTLDLSLLLAEQYKQLSNDKKAIALLVNNLDSTDAPWELNQKGKLLLDLGVPEKAIKAFRLAKKDSSGWQDAGNFAKAMIENGLYKEARPYLVEETLSSWKKTEALRTLLDYDLKYSPVDSAKATYDQLVSESFWNDWAGVDRLRLFYHAPWLKWSLKDFLRMGLLFLLLMLALVLPYLWILPIHYGGTYLKNRGMILPASEFRWGLRHLWLASSLYLLVSVLSVLIYDYKDLLGGNALEEAEAISNKAANLAVFSFTGFLLTTVLLLKKPDFSLIWGKIWDKKKSIFTGIGLAFLLRIWLAIYLKIYSLSGLENEDSLSFLAATDVIAINKFYHPLVGFLFVVLVVPVYEEILFRGVFLSSCEKYMKFFFANCIQAFVFALIHQEWKLFPFFFAFGFLAGLYKRKSQSLATGISMHATNNFLAFLALSALGKT